MYSMFIINCICVYTFRYTGHCPTLKFRVGKRFGANTEEIMKVKISLKASKKIIMETV